MPGSGLFTGDEAVKGTNVRTCNVYTLRKTRFSCKKTQFPAVNHLKTIA